MPEAHPALLSAFLGNPEPRSWRGTSTGIRGACTKSHYPLHLLSTGLLGGGDSNSPVLSGRQEDPCELILLLGCPWDTESATGVQPTLATWHMKAKQVSPSPSLLLLPPPPLHNKPWRPSPMAGRSVSSSSSDCEIPPKTHQHGLAVGLSPGCPLRGCREFLRAGQDVALPKRKGLGGSGVFFIADSIRTGRKTIFPSFCIVVII